MSPRVLPQRFQTADDLLRLAHDDRWRTELVKGQLVREPPAGAMHGAVSADLIARLVHHVREQRLGVVLSSETGFVVGSDPDTVRAPDAAFLSRERIPEGGLPNGFCRVAPDLAVEVVSPSNTARAMAAKVLDYLAAGTRIVWVVDPFSRVVMVYRGLEDIRILPEGSVLSGEDVVPGFEVPVTDLFRPGE